MIGLFSSISVDLFKNFDVYLRSAFGQSYRTVMSIAVSLLYLRLS